VTSCTGTGTATSDDGKLIIEVLLLLTADADADRDRDGEIGTALGAAAGALPRTIVTVPDDEIVMGPTGKVRKFLMRQRLLAGMSGSGTE
jgi:hypothetical protein